MSIGHFAEVLDINQNFNEEKFIEDLSKQPWEHIYFSAEDPNAMWEIWKKVFLDVLDKHAPLQHKKIRSRKAPWITNDIKNLMNGTGLKEKPY